MTCVCTLISGNGEASIYKIYDMVYMFFEHRQMLLANMNVKFT